MARGRRRSAVVAATARPQDQVMTARIGGRPGAERAARPAWRFVAATEPVQRGGRLV